jgi:hypothetical protein
LATLFRRQKGGISSGSSPDSALTSVGPMPEDAWRTLALMVDWIKHAESKATATLASAGLAGGLLYTLVSPAGRRGVALTVVASACAIAITAAAVAAGTALLPRIGSRQEPGGLIFYRGISDRYSTDAEGFATAYHTLVADRPALFAALTQQIWANAKVAARKYRALNVALLALLPALVLLTATAVMTLFSK